jgi:phosphoserine phosphatase RsbU/P
MNRKALLFLLLAATLLYRSSFFIKSFPEIAIRAFNGKWKRADSLQKAWRKRILLEEKRQRAKPAARGKYATFFYAVYDSDQQILHDMHAGHLPSMLFRSNGEIDRLKAGGMVMGMFPEASYRKDQITMRKGDLVLVYTDGVSEAMNAKEEEFGEDRLMQLVKPKLHRSASEISDVVLVGVEEFVQDAPQHDDITLVIVRCLE